MGGGLLEGIISYKNIMFGRVDNFGGSSLWYNEMFYRIEEEEQVTQNFTVCDYVGILQVCLLGIYVEP